MLPGRLCVCAVFVSLFARPTVWAQQTDTASTADNTTVAATTSVPRLVRFGGLLKDSAGNPLTGTVNVSFAIYRDQSDATPLWQETQTLQLDEQGRYTALLGTLSAEGLPMDLFASGQARWEWQRGACPSSRGCSW